MIERMPIYIGHETIEQSIGFCQERAFDRFLLVADSNTYRVLGASISAAYQAQGWNVKEVILESEGLIADDVAAERIFAQYDDQQRLLIAVGSGTITDLTRYVSSQVQSAFICFPTAPSVDAYTSIHASMTINHLKYSILCAAPIAIFTDLTTICAAPQRLIASGFGDLCAKFSSTADWKVSHLIWGTGFSQNIYESGISAADRALTHVDAIAVREERGLQAMMEAQFQSGFTMADFGRSDPASGLEHHIAHVWEMQADWQGQHQFLHGEAVGVALLHTAQGYEKLRAIDKKQAAILLADAQVPYQVRQEQDIRQYLAPIAETILQQKTIYWRLAEVQILQNTTTRILDCWEQIQTAAAIVPSVDVLRASFGKLGTPNMPHEIGIVEEDVQTGLRFAHYLRERFGIGILGKLLRFFE